MKTPLFLCCFFFSLTLLLAKGHREERCFYTDKHSKCVYLPDLYSDGWMLVLSDDVSFAHLKELSFPIHIGDHGVLYLCQSAASEEMFDYIREVLINPREHAVRYNVPLPAQMKRD